MELKTFSLESETSIPGGCVTNSSVKGGLREKEDYKVAFRAGGEKLHIRHDRRLKNLFQEKKVPTWLRDRIPLIYSGDELVAVAALPGWGVPMTIADGWMAQPDEQGLKVSLILYDRVC